jgi:hypothetical protein
MVCFTIHFAQPVLRSEKQRVSQEKRFQHLCKHYNASPLQGYEEDGIEYLSVAVCDFEAVDLLRDIPEPITCLSVKLHRHNVYLYKNYKLVKEECIPPRDLLLKKVYWMASKLERRQLLL